MAKALLFLTSHTELGDTGRSTGWFLPEAAHPWKEFTDAGWGVEFVSPKGGRSGIDGQDLTDPVQAEFLRVFGATGPDTKRPDQVDGASFDAVLYVGGHGAMWDFPDDVGLQAISREVWEGGGIVAAVCHGPAGLLNLRLSDGTLLVEGRHVAAFTDHEEATMQLTDVVPFLLSSTLATRGALPDPADDWVDHVVVDDRLVTGQNPASATSTARAVLATAHLAVHVANAS